MKILHVIPSLAATYGGPVNALFGLIGAQIDAGNEVRVLGTDLKLSHRERQQLPSYCDVASCMFSQWAFSLELVRILIERCRSVDVVHIHTIWEFPTLCAAVYCNLTGTHYIVRPCGMLDRWSVRKGSLKKRIYLALFGNLIFSNNCQVHFTSEGERSKSISVGNTRDFVLPNGVDIGAAAEADENGFYEIYPELKGHTLVMFLGRLHPKKQPELLIKAFSRMCSKTPDARLIFVGPGEKQYVEELRALVIELDLQREVVFTGMMVGNQKFSAMRAANIFVLPSRQENFGIAVAEALAVGVPVVITKEVDLSPYVIKIGAGIVCNSCIDEVAHAITTLIEDPSLCDELANRSANNARVDFDWARISAKLEQYYER